MKKEYIILGLIIAALSAYLIMYEKDQNNYILPSIPQINVAEVTEIVISRGGKDTLLSKKDDTWVVTDKRYPASQESVTQMLDIVKDLKLSALVSESGNLTPYELDSKNRISVTVKSKTGILRKFEIGKTAQSFRHTFVQLDGNSNVYHAEKSFRREFDKTVDDLRDKKVLSFDKNKISLLTVKKGDKVKDVAIKDGKPVENKNQKAVEALLTMLSDFQCHSFTDTDIKDEFKGLKEAVTIVLKGDKEHSIVLYSKDAKGNYPALSSGTIYPFMVQTYQGDDLISKSDDL